MAVILNIESSGSACSVALGVDLNLEFNIDERTPMKQATLLAPFTSKALEEVTRKGLKLDAIAVSQGPGSYTGLRIGMSLAKGLAYSMDVPLIGVSTLEIIAVKAMFQRMDWTGEEILVPMIDARRMEVYTAAYDFFLHPLMEPQAMVVKSDSFNSLPEGRPVWFMGDGAMKTKDVIRHPDAQWIDGMVPVASDMIALSEKAFREEKFIDKAYAGPLYIKDYNAIIGENPLKHLLDTNVC